MSTSFITIYTQAINKIEDPRLTKKFEESIIGFCNIMYNFLVDAIPNFTTPSFITSKLSDITNPVYYEQQETCNGVDVVFIIKYPINDTGIIEVDIDGNNKVGFTVNYQTSSIILDVAPTQNSTLTIKYYEDGFFNKNLNDEEIGILSDILIYCWATKEENYLLDIRRLLQDTDFKLHNASQSISGKIGWINNLRETWQKRMNNYAWNQRYDNSFVKNFWKGGRR